jgi:DNA-binding transcriptional LysR family regulator
MEMRHLRYFVTLAETANFRRAAERLGMAQPPLSRQIRALETELGCELLTRTPHGVELTPAGRAFLEQARITLAAAQRAVDRARVAAPEAVDRLVIGAEPSAAMAVVGRALARVAREHPTLSVELHDQTHEEALRALRGGVTHAAVVALPAFGPTDELVVHPIAQVPLCLAVGTGHPFAGPQPVSWRRLADVPLVLFARDAAPAVYDAIARTFEAEGMALKPRHRATDLTSALLLVAAGLGISIVPAGWQLPRAFGVTCRPLRPPLTSIGFGVACRAGAAGPAVRRFVAALRADRTTIAPTARPRGRARATSATRQLA